MSIILKGSQVAKDMKEKLAKEIKDLKEKNILPHLGIVRVGNREDDLAYERSAKKRMESIGIMCTVFQFPENIKQEEFVKELERINDNKGIHGILLFRPLPKHLNEKELQSIINPSKDVDCMNPINIAKVFSGDEFGYAPCTAEAVMELLDYYNINVEGKRVTVIGRSMVVGKPLAMLMLKKNGTVTICHTKTNNLEEVCREADILVAAAGKAKVINERFVKEDSIVIDVGISVDDEGNICGDVDYESVVDKVAYITPVPGGVGSITTLVLAKHVMEGAKFLNS
ncbi:MAG: tetrahydrofolate dehydrogenase/cyclohydrolase catalytic domain-containing protein [Clostridium sp.]|nr:tetrahydrofolate dehydrogenase/cyclohydrolase catalytic domain-containing protein [Clostridium sp.]